MKFSLRSNPLASVFILTGLCGFSALLASPWANAEPLPLTAIVVKQKSKLPPVPKPKCLKWTEQVVPFNLVLPKTFASGCGYYIPLRGNNETTIAYVLKNGVNPNLPAQLGELTPKFERQLDGFVEKAEALKIVQYSPNTLGSQKQIENITQNIVFVEDSGGLCKRFDRRVVCLESRALSNLQLVQMLKARPEPAPRPSFRK